MIKNFKRPILAVSLLKASDPHTDEAILSAMSKLRYPVLATLKLDGIRALRLGTSLVSRTLKPIPNVSICSRAMKLPEGFDMELFNSELQYDEIESIVMSREHTKSDIIQFHILDYFTITCSYDCRINACLEPIVNLHITHTILGGKWLRPVECNNAQELFNYFIFCEKNNGEGICFRTPDSPYKQGRSTLKEQYLVKLARFHTSEAFIIGFEEQLENANVTQRNATGAMDRSSCGANLYGKNTLGSLIVRDLKSGVVFKIGTGFDDKVRKEIWLNKNNWLNTVVSYKCKSHGEKFKPRCPVYRGKRKEIDII